MSQSNYTNIGDLDLQTRVSWYCKACGEECSRPDLDFCFLMGVDKPGTIEVKWVPIHPPLEE
jgi:hypothetical protein